MRELVTVAQERAADDVPGVVLVGALLGAVLLIAAVRAMFGRRR